MSDLVKTALAPATLSAMTNAVKGFGSGAGMGALVGGGAGALLGAGKGYQRARGQGESVGEAAVSGLGGSLHGAWNGARAGALVGGIGGAAAPGLAKRLSQVGSLSGASRFGQRQIHSLTGVGDAAYVRSIGGGAADAHERLVSATGALRKAPDAAARAKAMGGVNNARRSFKASEKSEAMGLTSIPGYAKALMKNPREAIATGVKDQWHSMGAGGKAMIFGLPAAGAANELRQGGEDAEGKGRFERTGSFLGMTATGMLAPLSIGVDYIASGMASRGLGRTGRFLDRLGKRQHPAAPLSQDAGGGAAQASSHVLSDRAAGTAAESVTG